MRTFRSLASLWTLALIAVLCATNTSPAQPPSYMWANEPDLYDYGFLPSARAYLSDQETPEEIAEVIIAGASALGDIPVGMRPSLFIQNNATPASLYSGSYFTSERTGQRVGRSWGKTWPSLDQEPRGVSGDIEREMRADARAMAGVYSEAFKIVNTAGFDFGLMAWDIEGYPLGPYDRVAEYEGWPQANDPGGQPSNWGGVGWGQHRANTLDAYYSRMSGLRGNMGQWSMGTPAVEVWGCPTVGYWELADETFLSEDRPAPTYSSPVMYQQLRRLDARVHKPTGGQMPYAIGLLDYYERDNADIMDPKTGLPNYENPLDALWRIFTTQVVKVRQRTGTEQMWWVHEIENGDRDGDLDVDFDDWSARDSVLSAVWNDVWWRLSYETRSGRILFNPHGFQQDVHPFTIMSLDRHRNAPDRTDELLALPKDLSELHERDTGAARSIFIDWIGDPKTLAKQFNCPVPDWLSRPGPGPGPGEGVDVPMAGFAEDLPEWEGQGSDAK